MTSFDRGQLERFRRTVTPGVAPRIERDVTPNAPGLVTPPPVSGGITLAQQLTDLIAQTGQLGREAQQTAAQSQYFDRLDAAKIEDAQRKADQEYEAQARVDAAIDGPRIQAEIASGALRRSDPEQSDEDFARAIASGNVPAGMSDTYRREYETNVAVAASRAIQARNEKAREIALRERTTTLINGAVNVHDADTLQASATALTEANPDIGPEAARQMIGKRALEWAATAGDRAALDAARAFLGAGYGPELADAESGIALAEARVASKETQRVAEAEDQAVNELAQMEVNGAPTAWLRTFVKNDKRFQSVTRREQLARFDRMDSGNISEAQSINANTLARRVGLGDWIGGTPEATVQEITRRSGLEPTDPQFLPWSSAGQMLDGIDRALRVAADDQIAGAMFAEIDTTGRARTAATDAMDDGILRQLSARGAVTGIDSDGKFTLAGVSNPSMLAEYARATNHVPSQVRDQIIAGAGSQDADQVADALTAWAALDLRDQELAARVNLHGDGAVRARYISARLRQELPRSKWGDDAAVRDAIRREAPNLLRLDPRFNEISKEQVKSTVWFDGGKIDFAELDTMARKEITKVVRSDYTGIRRGKPDIPADMIQRYTDLVAEEFRFHRSFAPTDDLAAQEAKRFAAFRLFSEYPATDWGGTPRFMGLNQVAPDAVALRRDAAASLGEDAAEALWNNSFPEWAGNGWLFRSLDPPFAPALDDNGLPIVLNPGSEWVREETRAGMKLATEARAARAARRAKGRDVWYGP